jgi:murein L,D-transpeptidase YcbB/YkuD
LRTRLQLLGDLPANGAGPEDEIGIYTPALADGVRHFQSRHGLAEDGVLGAASLAALAVPPGQRATQLALTLERLRSLPHLPAGRFVAVNLPAYRLWAFDSGAGAPEPRLEMRVIVGTAARTQTPLFIGRMRYLEFNPYWNVPPSIQASEIVPKLARTPGYLRANDMEIVTPSGTVLDGASAAAALRGGGARVRQRPGPRNALGALKFAMPNPMNIYLHSTPSRELFGRSRRDLSHGCIRVEQPVALAAFVLADPVTWSTAAVEEAIARGRTQTVMLPRTVPVILFYATAVVDRDGRAVFADDIYRLDAALLAQLRGRAER